MNLTAWKKNTLFSLSLSLSLSLGANIEREEAGELTLSKRLFGLLCCGLWIILPPGLPSPRGVCVDADVCVPQLVGVNGA